MPGAFQVQGNERTFRIVIDKLDGGWSTRTFPHLLQENQLFVADNVVFNRDGLVSKRPGNINYGGGTGKTGSAQPSLAGVRFYYGNPVAGKLLVQSGGNLYQGTDSTGAFASIMAGLSTTQPAAFAQMYDPDAGAGSTELFVCDGSRIPQLWNGTTASAVQTGFVGGVQYLPNGRTGAPITPKYAVVWNEHLVYAGEPTEPSAVYISDALRPQRFTGFAFTDSAGSPYIPYFPGAFQYQFSRVSSSIGAVAPQSIVSFDTFVVFFGGDRFYATDSTTVVPIPDLIPSVYANTAQSVFPSEMATKNSVVGARRAQQYWASYDVIGLGTPTRIVVFDFAANGGWTFGGAVTIGVTNGGAWSRWPTGMALGWGIECRGPGDKQQMFWGSSQADVVAQHDTGVYSDFGNAIALEIRAKSFFLDKPIWPKTIQGLYPLLVYAVQGAAYSSTITPYVVLDQQQDLAPPISVPITPNATAYGVGEYGTFTYGASNQLAQVNPKGYPGQPSQCFSFSPGVTENSVNPFNLIGFVVEVTVDEPAP
jgi:hypothetical protein